MRVSRKVVRKVIRTNSTEFHYERSQQPLPRIGPWREQLEALLDENDSRAPRERLTLIRIFEDLRALGYAGSYAAVRRYAIAWRGKRASATADAYVPLSFARGEAYQFDWSHELALIDGVTTTLNQGEPFVWAMGARWSIVAPFGSSGEPRASPNPYTSDCAVGAAQTAGFVQAPNRRRFSQQFAGIQRALGQPVTHYVPH